MALNYVAQLLPDEEQAVVLLEAIDEYVGTRGRDFENSKVMAAEEIKLEILQQMRRKKKQR